MPHTFAEQATAHPRLLVTGPPLGVDDLLPRALAAAGFVVRHAVDGASVVREVVGADVVLVGSPLSDMPVAALCRRLRTERTAVGIVVVTVRTNELETVDALDCGADDVVVASVPLAELSARVRSVARRLGAGDHGLRDSLPTRLAIDTHGHRAFAADLQVHLTATELTILTLLDGGAGRVITHEALAAAIWPGTVPGSRAAVGVHVARLRAKLRAAGWSGRIVSVRGIGLRLEPKRVRPDD